MDSIFLSYELSLELKKLGFSEPCIAKYTKVDDIDFFWLSIKESAKNMNSKSGKGNYGNLINYNTKFYEKEGSISAPTFSQAINWLSSIGAKSPYGGNISNEYVLQMINSLK